jgi:hypothetical protein
MHLRVITPHKKVVGEVGYSSVVVNIGNLDW